jgi:phospholipase C
MQSQRVLSPVLTPALMAFSGCGGFRSLPSPEPANLPQVRADLASPIEHVVIMIQENRSFNDFFATFPGADGTTTDERATSIIDCFDYSQKPRKFVPIAVKYPESYFLTRPPSYRPVDTDM